MKIPPVDKSKTVSNIHLGLIKESIQTRQKTKSNRGRESERKRERERKRG